MTETPTTLKAIATSFLKVGATAYGGPAIMGIMQAEFQEKRRWISKPQFLEGLSLVNMLPGATAVQLGIFLGYQRAGWWGGLLAGLGFVVPAFVVMLALAMAYAALGVSPLLRGALYGLGPVVLGVFVVAVYRLGRSAVRSAPHVFIAVGATVAAAATPIGTATVLVLAGALGVLLFHSKRMGVIVLAACVGGLAVVHAIAWSPAFFSLAPRGTPRLTDLAILFSVIGAFTFGGGLTMLAFLQDQVVNQLHWLTPQEFIDGLALGQLTPGPVLMLAAYVGYKTLGIAGAVVGAVSIFLPSFVLMLSVLPVFDRVRALAWARAAMQGIAPAVIGVLSVALTGIAPHAVPDPFAAAVMLATVIALLFWRLGPLKLVAAGAAVGVLRSRLWPLPWVPQLR
jgi:chromate transporter